MFNVLNLVLETNSKSNLLKFNKNQLQISKFSSIDRLSVAVEKMMTVVQRLRKDDDGGVEKKNSIKRKERLKFNNHSQYKWRNSDTIKQK